MKEGTQRMKGDAEWNEVGSGKWQVSLSTSHFPLPTSHVVNQSYFKKNPASCEAGFIVLRKLNPNAA